MTLAEAREGQRFLITAIKGDTVTVEAVRFGIDEGTVVYVEKNIKGGPVIVCKNHLEIAIGRELARSIEGEPRG